MQLVLSVLYNQHGCTVSPSESLPDHKSRDDFRAESKVNSFFMKQIQLIV
jgi:hypothetical protein